MYTSQKSQPSSQWFIVLVWGRRKKINKNSWSAIIHSTDINLIRLRLRVYNGNKPDRLVITLKSAAAAVTVSIIHKFHGGGAPVLYSGSGSSQTRSSENGGTMLEGTLLHRVWLCIQRFFYTHTIYIIQLARREGGSARLVCIVNNNNNNKCGLHAWNFNSYARRCVSRTTAAAAVKSASCVYDFYLFLSKIRFRSPVYVNCIYFVCTYMLYRGILIEKNTRIKHIENNY